VTLIPATLLPDPALPAASDFREAMSRVAGAVNIITTDGAGGKSGFTATAMVSVSDTPPTLLVCANATSRTLVAIQRNQRFAVNVLAADARAIAEAFTGKTGLGGAERFTIGDWQAGALGQPMLAGALAAFECDLAEAKPVAGHVVLIGTIRAISLGSAGEGLAYARRKYHVV